ncbi:biotin carboxylase N-terminal domain-containing protein [Blastococcus sp. SYSU D00669]
MFSEVLVANRGEIAVRAFRAAYELGLSTVAVFADEDRNSVHRLEADESYRIGRVGHPVRAHLSVDEVRHTARRAGGARRPPPRRHRPHRPGRPPAPSGSRPVSTSLFRWLCEELGYAPEHVLSVRLNRTEAVVVTRDDAGQLRVVNHLVTSPRVTDDVLTRPARVRP